jgi:CRP-like cAMP-binding protein
MDKSEINNIFSGVKEEEINCLIKSSFTRNFEKGEYIVQSGQEGHSLYIILFGRVKVLMPSRDGRAHKLLTFLESGECFGEIAIVLKSKRTADVIATTTTKVLVLSEQETMNFMAQHTKIMFNMLKYSLNRVYQLSIDSEISTLKAPEKIFYLLKYRFAKTDEKGQEYIPKNAMPSIIEIGEYAGLHRSTAHDNFKKLMEDERLIEKGAVYYLSN